MGVISTFDPKYKKKLYNECISDFGVENVVLIKKSKLFLTFFVLIPTIGWIATLTGVIFLIIFIVERAVVNANIALRINIISIIIVLTIRIGIPGVKILKYYLDYCMDFSIVTPQSFIRYDQTGFFKRTSKVIDLVHIRSVSVQRTGVLNSLFNNGNIIVLSEGSDFMGGKDSKENAGKIYFRYVYNPEYYSHRIEGFLRELNVREQS